MKTIYPTLGIVLSIILTSCGMNSNFSKRKYTNFKKYKAEFKATTNENSHQEDVISYQERTENFNEKESTVISEVIEDNQVVEIEDVVLEQGYKKVINKNSVKKESADKKDFKLDSPKSVLFQKNQNTKEDPELSKIGQTILLNLLFILLLIVLLYLALFVTIIVVWLYGALYGLGMLFLSIGILIAYIILCVNYLIKLNR